MQRMQRLEARVVGDRDVAEDAVGEPRAAVLAGALERGVRPLQAGPRASAGVAGPAIGFIALLVLPLMNSFFFNTRLKNSRG